MENRYNKITVIDQRGRVIFTHQVGEGEMFKTDAKSGELRIETVVNGENPSNKVTPDMWEENLPVIQAGQYADELSVYVDSEGNKAVIPPGFVVSGAEAENTIWGKNSKLVIYNIPKECVDGIKWYKLEDLSFLQQEYNQFEWCPVSLLPSDGTIDGENFTQKYGRRNDFNDDFSENGYNEPLDDELNLEKESSDKYSGFWVSRYKIQCNKKSVKNINPLTGIYRTKAERIASTMFEHNDAIFTQLLSGAAFDTIERWKSETEQEKYESDFCEYTLENYMSPFYDGLITIRDSMGRRKNTYSVSFDRKHSFRVAMFIKP